MKNNEFGDVLIPAIVFIAIALCVFCGTNYLLKGISKIDTEEKQEKEARVERYNNAVKDGYKVYYNGTAASGDALAIDIKTIGDFDIVFDDENKAIKVKDKRHYSGGSDSFYYINGRFY